MIRVVPWTTAFAIRGPILSAATSPDVATAKRTSRDVVATVAKTAFGTLILTIPKDAEVKRREIFFRQSLVQFARPSFHSVFTRRNSLAPFAPSRPVAACTCNTLGTVDNQGCNTVTGECTCKRYVTTRDCNQCLPNYWGLSEDRDGCKACDCDPGGSYEDSCDVITGQCRCRPHVSGRSCNQPEQSYYTGSLDFLVYEGELSRASDVSRPS